MKKYLLISVGIMIGLSAVYFVVSNYREKVLGKASSEFTKYATDVVGTHSGTSTTGVAFRITGSGGITASTSYVSRLGPNIGNAIYMFKATAASTTALAQFEFFGTNDDFCDATATSTSDAACVGDCILTSDINWYSAGDNLQNRTHLSNLLNDSSTSFLSWTNPTSTLAKPGPQVLLTNLNYNCLRLDVAASSTVLYAGVITK